MRPARSRAAQNELAKAGLTADPRARAAPPRIAECRSHFECKVEWTRSGSIV